MSVLNNMELKELRYCHENRFELLIIEIKYYQAFRQTLFAEEHLVIKLPISYAKKAFLDKSPLD